MRTNELATLREVLAELEALPWDHALFVENCASWRLTTAVAVLDPDDVDSPDPDADPALAQEHGLEYAISVASAQDVLSNLRSQINTTPTADQLLVALEHYRAHDAFLTAPAAWLVTAI